jgi:hypothetical protein
MNTQNYMIHNLTKARSFKTPWESLEFFPIQYNLHHHSHTYYKEDHNDDYSQVVMNHVKMFILLFNMYIILTPICTNLSLDL